MVALTKTSCLKLGKSKDSQPLSDAQANELRDIIERIRDEIEAKSEDAPFRFDRNSAWSQHFGHSEFRLSIIASQRLCYGGLYFAYESFIVECYKLLSGKPHYQTGGKTKQDFTSVFGEIVCDRCWSDDHVVDARLVRHALVHAGGRITNALKQRNLSITIIDSEIQITATDTADLFKLLKTRALQLAEITLTKLKAQNETSR